MRPSDQAQIAIGQYKTFTLDTFGAEIQAALKRGAAEAHRAIEDKGNALGTVINGWQDIPPMGRYGTDFLFRAAVAWKFIYTYSPEEALYPIAETDAGGQPLNGSARYELHFPAGQLPPVDAFWSVTLYESENRLMTSNPIHRYSIGDRTPGLTYNADGSLALYIQHESPGVDREANWLPAPTGRFYLNARAYMPKREFLDGRYRLPAVCRTSDSE